MDTSNFFTKARRFAEIVEDSNALAILLCIAKHDVRNYDELAENIGMEYADVVIGVKKLTEHYYIEPNPNPASHKFRLTLNGQLLVEQLRRGHPEVKELLGDKKIITPIRIKN